MSSRARRRFLRAYIVRIARSSSSTRSRCFLKTHSRTCPCRAAMRCMEKKLISAPPKPKKQRSCFSSIPELPVGPAALLVLLAAATRAGRVRLGLLPRGRPGQCLARVVADHLVDSSQRLGCLGIALCRRQREEPPGLWVVLGDACSIFVTCLKG